MSLGKRLRAIRTSNGLTQKNIADILGMDRTTYTFYENESTCPSINTVYNLSKIYKVTVGYLLGVEKNDPSRCVSAEDEVEVRNSDCANLEPQRLSKQERYIIAAFRALGDEGKNDFLQSIKSMTDEKKSSLKDVSDKL